MEAESTRSPEGRWLGRAATAFQTALFGYDFFISYRHADASTYARSLQARLGRRFDCFLDEQHYEAGYNLPKMQSQALKRARKLLVVVSPQAHRSPDEGIDWLLAEVLEFKHLTRKRGGSAAIVPIGTARTLSVASHPSSRLLPEIPTPDSGDICIFDDAVERNAEVADRTVEKLTNDFREVRRRRVRLIASWGASIGIGFAIAFGVFSLQREAEARRTARVGEAFRLLDRGREELDRRDVGTARDFFSRSSKQFTDLGLDPLMALHSEFAAGLRELHATELGELDGETSFLKVSADGDWILVVYDYQAPNGSPDLEDILDWPAFGVFRVSERQWILRRTLDTEIGKEVYEQLRISEFLPPDHVVAKIDDGHFNRVSLVDGTREPVDASASEAAASSPSPHQVEGREEVKARLEDLLSHDRLFTVQPEEGIDLEYGPRLVDRIYVEAPDRRTAIVGTYEGRLMLVDLGTGATRGEMRTAPIFDAAYGPDGSRAYVAAKDRLWEIETGEMAGTLELHAPLRQFSPIAWDREKVLAAVLADDASLLALATTRRLLARSVRDAHWREWSLPRPIEKAAALRVDRRRSRIDFVAADDGSIASVSYVEPGSSLALIPRPGGPVPTLAWMDPSTPIAWLIGVKWLQGRTQVLGVPLPGGDESAVDLTIDEPPNDSGFDTMAIHALAKLDRNVFVFFGDEEYFEEGRELVDEQLLKAPVDGSAAPVRSTLFESDEQLTGVGTISTCTQVTSVLPHASANEILVTTQLGVHVIRSNGESRGRTGRVFEIGHMDADQSYVIGIDADGDDHWFEVGHGGTGTSVRYLLPWGEPLEPTFVSVTPSGRQVLLADEAGAVLLVDVSGALGR